MCVDLTKLNERVCRENYPLPKIDSLLGGIGDSAVFGKAIYANSGFWQAKLAEKSQLLTTFLTPFGRYCFQRLPFGLKSAPERFQRIVLTELAGLDGMICIMDDILVHGRTQTENDKRLDSVLARLTKAKITLNPVKCEFSKRQLKFAGHNLSAQGIGPDWDKTADFEKMERPRNIPELRRLLGMINHQQKFIKNLSEKTRPLRDLLSSKNEWLWGSAQEEAFTRLKNHLVQAPVLAHYCTEKETIVSADASSYGLGAVIFQVQDDGTKKPVAYASRSMTSTE